jgi:hypothetical protein
MYLSFHLYLSFFALLYFGSSDVLRTLLTEIIRVGPIILALTFVFLVIR